MFGELSKSCGKVEQPPMVGTLMSMRTILFASAIADVQVWPADVHVAAVHVPADALHVAAVQVPAGVAEVQSLEVE